MPSSDYTPTNENVANLLRARTVDDDGNELGAFTPETKPTGDQAEVIIAEAVDEIAGRIGQDIPAKLFKPAKAVTALLSAMNVESTYYPEAINNDNRSPYLAYERRVNAALDPKKGWLILAIKDQAAGGEDGPGDDQLDPIFFSDAVYSADFVYDPVTQRWIARDAPEPYADEGGVLGVWA